LARATQICFFTLSATNHYPQLMMPTASLQRPGTWVDTDHSSTEHFSHSIWTHVVSDPVFVPGTFFENGPCSTSLGSLFDSSIRIYEHSFPNAHARPTCVCLTGHACRPVQNPIDEFERLWSSSSNASYTSLSLRLAPSAAQFARPCTIFTVI
jgi:hypothetical protein